MSIERISSDWKAGRYDAHSYDVRTLLLKVEELEADLRGAMDSLTTREWRIAELEGALREEHMAAEIFRVRAEQLAAENARLRARWERARRWLQAARGYLTDARQDEAERLLAMFIDQEEAEAIGG